VATRKGSAEWRGDLKGGSGRLKVGDGVFEGQYSFSSRFEEGEGTNPEELIAAAHAGCFTMALSSALAQAGNTPEFVRTTATVHLRAGPSIPLIELRTEGKVPGIDAATFEQRANEAKDECLISRVLAGVDEMTVEAKLVS
jgi:osmotically inducible protein OsmC